jgi:hypothetical protein
MERFAAVRSQIGYLLDVGRKVVEALGPQEEPFGHLWKPRQPERLSQCRLLGECRAVMIAIPPFRVESTTLRECFEQR